MTAKMIEEKCDAKIEIDTDNDQRQFPARPLISSTLKLFPAPAPTRLHPPSLHQNSNDILIAKSIPGVHDICMSNQHHKLESNRIKLRGGG